jgi:hypothetical protein
MIFGTTEALKNTEGTDSVASFSSVFQWFDASVSTMRQPPDPTRNTKERKSKGHETPLRLSYSFVCFVIHNGCRSTARI